MRFRAWWMTLGLMLGLTLALGACSGSSDSPGGDDVTDASSGGGDDVATDGDSQAPDDVDAGQPDMADTDPGDTGEVKPEVEDVDPDSGDTVEPEGPFPVACAADADCQIPCAQGACVGGACTFVPVPGRCVIPIGAGDQVDCFDSGDASPAEPCLFCAPNRAQDRWSGSMRYDAFKGDDLGSYLITDVSSSGVKWHRSSRRAVKGDFSLYAGSEETGTYDVGMALTTSLSFDVSLPKLDALTLRFDLWLETEGLPGYDFLKVDLIDVAGTEFPLFHSDEIGGSTKGVFTKIALDITPWGGQSVSLRFTFDSVDERINHFEGAYLDEIELSGGCCGVHAECDDLSPCTSETCLDEHGYCLVETLDDCCTLDADCDDGDACTSDTCTGFGQGCAHETKTDCCSSDADCDDANPCTADDCPVPGEPCVFTILCCNADAECDDGDPCTVEVCQNQTCHYTDTCCHADSDCDDGELCTKDACQHDGACSHEPAYLPGCCVPEIWDDDFDDGDLSDWYITGGDGSVGWHLVDKRASSPSYSVYYGDTATWEYGNSNEGSMLSEPMLLPFGVQVGVEMKIWLYTEASYDRLYVYVQTDDTEAEIWKSGSSDPKQQWFDKSLDISSFAGRQVRVRLRFKSDSSSFYEGVYVDDLRVTTSCSPKTCAGDGDCLAYGECWGGNCASGVCAFQFTCCATTEECEDGDVCTVDSCADGSCSNASIDGCCTVDGDCADGNPCTADACPGVGEQCQHQDIGGCCLTNGDCNDNNACTYDWCLDNTCDYTPACCATDSDCDDGDGVCTDDACVDGACVYQPTWSEGCCYPMPFAEDFDVLPLSFTLDDPDDEAIGWYHLEGGKSYSEPYALYYGNPDTLNYSTSNSGDAISQPFLLPPDSQNTLEFKLWQHVEGSSSYDYLRVFILHNDTEYQVWSKESYMTMQEWLTIEVDVSSFGGFEIQVKLYFYADGSVSYEGVYVDDLIVRSSCGPKPCTATGECPTYGSCFDSVCQEGICGFDFVCCLDSGDCDDQDPCTTDVCSDAFCNHAPIDDCCHTVSDCDDGNPCTEDGCAYDGAPCAHDWTDNCCLGHADCDDEDDCTHDACLEMSCVHKSLCCATDGDCDDGDDVCTTDACVDGLCEYAPVAADGCCQPIALMQLFDDVSGLTIDPPVAGVGWQVQADGDSPSGGPNIYYGDPDTGTYDNGEANAGSFRIEGLELSEDVEQRLAFEMWLHIEPGTQYDVLEVRLWLGETPYVVWDKGQLSGSWSSWKEKWIEADVDVSAFAGQTVTLEVRFDTVTGSVNQFGGLRIDNLRLMSPCLPRPCVEDSDCFDGHAYSTDTCEMFRCAYALGL
jgi:hypothetical protein